MKNFLFIAFLFMTNSVLALSIEGQVLNVNSSAPLDACRVLLMQDGKVYKTTSTNFEGKFSLEVGKDQNYTLEFLKSSYKIETIEIFTNQEFLNKNTSMKIYLHALSIQPKFVEMTGGTVKKEPNPDVMEDIGSLSTLPEGSKLIEAKPLKYSEKEANGFNVQKKNIDNKTLVDVNELKTEFNKESLKASINSDKEMFPSSFYAEGSIFYGSGKVLLTESVKEILNGIALKLNEDKSVKLSIKAYADADREVAVGTEVSKLRTEEIIKYLMQLDVDFSKLEIIVKGNGELENECYKDAACSEFEHQENRRVDLVFQN